LCDIKVPYAAIYIYAKNCFSDTILDDTQHVIIYFDFVTNTRHTSNQPQIE